MGALTDTRQTTAIQKQEAQYLTLLLGGEMFAIDIQGI